MCWKKANNKVEKIANYGFSYLFVVIYLFFRSSIESMSIYAGTASLALLTPFSLSLNLVGYLMK